MPNIVVLPRHSDLLPDNKQFTNRFGIHSESSDRVYIVAQHKTGRWWSCGCFGFIRHRYCKHLAALGIPGHSQPYEALLK
jgi:hypothetical protein